MAEIKLATIAEIARPRPHTVPFLLKEVPDLVGGRGPRGRGHHRVFTPAQAFRVAVVAITMELRFTLAEARSVLTLVESRMANVDNYLKLSSKLRQATPAPADAADVDFTLFLADGRYAAVHRVPAGTPHHRLAWHRVGDLSGAGAIAEPAYRAEVNLSRLRREFATTAAEA